MIAAHVGVVLKPHGRLGDAYYAPRGETALHLGGEVIDLSVVQMLNDMLGIEQMHAAIIKWKGRT